MNETWYLCKLILGIMSIVLAIAVFILEFQVLAVDLFSINGPNGYGGKGFIFSLLFLACGVIAIKFNAEDNGLLLCASLYGLGFLFAVFQYSRNKDAYIVQSRSLYGLICLIFYLIILFLIGETRRNILIPAILFLAIIGTGFFIIYAQRKTEQRKQRKTIEENRIYQTEILQTFDARTSAEIALDHLSYNTGMSKTKLILQLETMDGLSRDDAQKVADSLNAIWELHALYRACLMIELRSSYDERTKSTAYTLTKKNAKKIRENLCKSGFSKNEIAFVLENLDTKHIRDLFVPLSESIYFSRLVYSEVNREYYEKYYEKYF